jgi:hypothetical protein
MHFGIPNEINGTGKLILEYRGYIERKYQNVNYCGTFLC